MKTCPAPEPPVSTTAPAALWRLAAAFMRTLHALFGNPEDIAMGVAITKHARGMICAWLRVAEAMLRRLLLIEAANVPPPSVPPPSRRPAGKKPPASKAVRKHVRFCVDKPEDWRVSFRCFAGGDTPNVPPPSRRHAGKMPAVRKQRPRPTGYLYDARPLALRYEALIRVFNDPVPFARRLARRLRAQPNRAADLLRAPPDARHKIGDEALAALSTAAAAAAPALNSS